MQDNRAHLRDYLTSFDFKSLFIESLGWNHCETTLTFEIDGTHFQLKGVAEKCSLIAFVCEPCGDGNIPDRQKLLKIDRQLSKLHFEHLIICYDALKTIQRWLWIKRETGKQPLVRERLFKAGASGEPLIQALTGLATTLDEEENLTLTHMTGRVKAAFDVDKVTKRFYDRFKKEHDTFLDFIEGIPDADMKKWYASVMINRLMFIYFVQKKEFLDGDIDYLRNRLGNNGGSFYRAFLRPLFFEGFAKQQEERSDETNRLLGDIPYLNGGIFLPHSIEELYGDAIDIQDGAFKTLFDFFDQYRWHLDERPLRDDNEINPDVLGYIFEKYINQKQMGAYYTKEDITEYIGKNTIIPRIFDIAREKCRIAFEGEHSIWDLLRQDPDRYIYDAVKHGISVSLTVIDKNEIQATPLASPLPLPADIEAGIADVSKRTGWNAPASAEYALPTEIWREVVARRQRYDEIRTALESGEIRDINDLITYNLDIRRFALDVITYAESSDLVRAFYDAIEHISVLDPTCGSGAFLFAALNILEPLYEACIDRMRLFIDELDASGGKHSPLKYSDFRATLERIDKHPTPKYFIYKSIILNNLYGVDIMDEAVEICKLRLFLKLVAQVDSSDTIEPLPDIDFNIKAGNTLVGFATYDDVAKTAEDNIIKQLDLKKLDEKAGEVEELFALFRKQQEELGGAVSHDDKQQLADALRGFEATLNEWLAQEYEIDVKNRNAFLKWLQSHKPFHWFIEFYGIMKRGGFDVIIGNPPYVEYSKVKKEYMVRNYKSIDSGNLYSLVIERTIKLQSIGAKNGMIIQLSAFCTPRMIAFQDVYFNHIKISYLSFFDDRPGKLFDGLEHIRTAICIGTVGENELNIYTTRYMKFQTIYRDVLFQTIVYNLNSKPRLGSSILKLSSAIENSIINKLLNNNSILNMFLQDRINNNFVYYGYGFGYWGKILNHKSYFKGEIVTHSTGDKYIYCSQDVSRDVIVSIMNSTLFYWFYTIYSDGHNFTKHVIGSFPFSKPSDITQNKLKYLCNLLMKDLEKKSQIKNAHYKSTGFVEYQEFYPKLSKFIIDEIDKSLAHENGFTDEELDFIINYDIKYRMGDELAGE